LCVRTGAKGRFLALKETIDRYNHELLDDEERMLLLDRIRRLRKGHISD
jgi:hypothetical protein